MFSVDSISNEALHSSLSSADSLQDNALQMKGKLQSQKATDRRQCTDDPFLNDKENNPLCKPRSRLPFISDQLPSQFAAGR